MNRKPHKSAGYNFEVAEFYEGVGKCKPRGLILYGQPGMSYLARQRGNYISSCRNSANHCGLVFSTENLVIDLGLEALE